MLDPHAIVCLLRSGLPMAIYPCATHRGPFDYGRHNTFWKLNNLEFIRHMTPVLRRYLCFAFGRTIRMDFLRAMDVMCQCHIATYSIRPARGRRSSFGLG